MFLLPIGSAMLADTLRVSRTHTSQKRVVRNRLTIQKQIECLWQPYECYTRLTRWWEGQPPRRYVSVRELLWKQCFAYMLRKWAGASINSSVHEYLLIRVFVSYDYMSTCMHAHVHILYAYPNHNSIIVHT